MVREVSPHGIVTTVAGNGTTTDAPDGTVATQSGLNGPVSVAPLPDGSFIVTEYNGSVVRLVSAGPPGTATITTIAGTGSAAPSPQGIVAGAPATSTPLEYPSDAEITPDGQVLIADTLDNQVRLLSAPTPGATVTTVAGGGSCSDVTSACDGLSAGAVALLQPVSVSPLADGSGGYLVTERDADAVREITNESAGGTFSTVAGQPGQSGFAGDGGLAARALLDHPGQAVSQAGGGFLIADTNNNRIRQVDQNGDISTIAGDGVAAFAGDGGDATAASLEQPNAVASIAPAGSLLIADQDNGAIREVTIPPATTITLSPAAPNGTNGWYTSAVKVKITAVAASKTGCYLDPGGVPTVFGELLSPCAYTKGASVSGLGPHTVYAASENKFGDVEDTVASASFQIDTTTPVMSCVGDPSYPVTPDGVGQLHATVFEGVSGVTDPIAFENVDTSIIGSHTAPVTGTSVAGTTTTIYCPYTVNALVFKPAVAVSWTLRRQARTANTLVKHLSISNVPLDASIALQCGGQGCPIHSINCNGNGKGSKHQATKCRPLRHPPAGSKTVSFDVAPLFKGHPLGAGARLSLSITRLNTVGGAWQLKLNAGKAVKHSSLCLDPFGDPPGEGC
jgi:hypothetical protein